MAEAKTADDYARELNVMLSTAKLAKLKAMLEQLTDQERDEIAAWLAMREEAR